MLYKKIISLLLCGGLLCGLAACGTDSEAYETSETEEPETVENTIAFSDSSFSDLTFTGKVDSVEGNVITMSVAVMDGKAIDISQMMSQQPGGDAPSMPDGEGQNGAGQDAPEMPDGEGQIGGGQDAPSMPDGEGQNGGGQDAPSMPNGEGQDGGGQDAPSMPEGAGQNGAGQDAPETPDGEGQNGGGQDAPEMPDGEGQNDVGQDAPSMPEGEGQNGAGQDAPEKPDGEEQNGGEQDAPEMPDGAGQDMPTDVGAMETDTVTVTITIGDESVLLNEDSESATLSDIEEGDYLAVELDEEQNIKTITIKEISGEQMGGEPGSMGGGVPGGSSGVDSYDAATEFTADVTSEGETFTSTGADENAIHVYDGASVSLDDATITRTSDSSTGGDNSSFYGVGAALLTTDGTTRISGSTITTDAAGGAGIFSYGDGVTYVSDTTIRTKQDTSGGIHVAGGGTLYAWDLDVETDGGSSAAIRSDRGSGTMVVDGGTYVSNGTGSPAIYCTADITVNDATLTANNSEAICIEGLNTIRLFDCDLTGSIQDNSQNDCNWNVIVYQSMSGDSEVGNGTFSMVGGSLTAKNGGMFYTTNTECTFYLSGVDITYAEQNDFFLRCTGNKNARGWGNSGSNGSDCTFTADGQEMQGDIVYDSISNLDFYMINGSSLTGAVIDDESCAGNGGEGHCNVYISRDSVWTVTGDSILTALYSEGKIVDASGNAVTIMGTDGTVYVNGTSAYTITVESYGTSADLSGAAAGGSFSDYAVSK